ncbi:MAG: hypothetical protein M1579_03425 [Gammaproteobacteria bacterium]|nr:hypothetical protein [Gammaproteobacteria bacterium]
MRKTLGLIILLTLSLSSHAVTPSSVQEMIDAGQCSQALNAIVSERSANSNKESDILDALMIEASFCDGRINSENKAAALKTLKAIEQRNPMLIGLDKAGFDELKAKINSIQSSGDSSSWSDFIFLFVVLGFIIAGIAWIKSASKSSYVPKPNESFNNQLKLKLIDQANSLMLQIDNLSDKARIGGNTKALNRLLSFREKVDQLLIEVYNTYNDADLLAAKAKLANIAVMVKVS